ncbi:MAG: tRNA (N(6)-L-threonylcarbamoyladenosine(37)-C(2))-methylthiotransferase MtaB [Candidatus Edwardsbacteria bacterium]
MSQVSFITFGCKVNQYDTQSLREIFCRAGYSIVPVEKDPEICVINTCAVTQVAEQQARQAIHKISRKNPKPYIIVTGCYAQINPERIGQIDEVDLVLGLPEENKIIELLEEKNLSRVRVTPIHQIVDFTESPVCGHFQHTRAFLKIQDGCDAFCSYCIVPYTRGKSRRRALNQIIDEAKRLTEAGFQEIVLTGVHLEGEHLLQVIPHLEEIKKLHRLRLSSLEVNEFSPELIELIKKSHKICHHLHIPLQSGSENVLQKMNRPYTPERYRRLVNQLIAEIPDLAVGTDIMVGFPGETEDDFSSTYKLIEEVPFAYLHIFNYSLRKGTLAASFKETVPSETKARRSKTLRILTIEKKKSYLSRFLGKEIEVIIESKRDKQNGCLTGISGNYLKIFIVGRARSIGEGADEFKDKLARISIEKISDGQLFGSFTDF